MIITIDGPVASGKSTVGRLLAQRLDYYYICSGYLYRAMAYVLVTYYGYDEKTITSPTDEDLEACCMSLVYVYEDGLREKVFFNGRDITSYLKDSYIDKITSIISVSSRVRECVTSMQHTLASHYDTVIDGRDTGSAVFPHAEVKFFITAAVEVRAQRWLNDQNKTGHNFSLEQAIAKITDRDERDKRRTIAPLVIPHDAHIIDTSHMTIEKVIDVMMEYCTKKLA